LTGCVYNGAIRGQPLNIPYPLSDSKYNLRIAVVLTNALKTTAIQDKIGAYNLNIAIYPKIRDVLYLKLKEVFSDVVFVEDNSFNRASFDVLVYPYFFTDNGVNLGLKGYNPLTYKELFNVNNKIKIEYTEPSSVNTLAIITSATLLLLSPITIPIIAQITGKEYEKDAFYAIDSATNNLAYALNQSPTLRQYAANQKVSTKTIIEPKHDDIKETEEPKADLLLQKFIKENPQSFVEKAYIGFWVIKNYKNELEITYVDGSSPAGAIDIRTGDIIESVDNVAIKDRKTFFSIFDRKNPGDFIDVVLKRDGKLINKNFKLTSHHFPYDMHILRQKVIEEDPINLAIIIGDISNVYLQDKTTLEEWKRGMKSFINSNLENYYLRILKYEGNFSIVDRQKTEIVLSEFAFQQSGLIQKESQAKLGKMLGATHLLIIDYSRFYLSPIKAHDVQTHKLIEIESGKTLANTVFKTTAELESDVVKKDATSKINVEQDLINYYNNELQKVGFIEKDAVEAYSSVTENNYIDDSTLHNTLINVVIPKYEIFVQKLEKISNATDEVQNLHKIYIEGANLQLDAFKTLLSGVEKQDKMLIYEANEKLRKGKDKIRKWQTELDTIIKKYNLNIYK